MLLMYLFVPEDLLQGRIGLSREVMTFNLYDNRF